MPSPLTVCAELRAAPGRGDAVAALLVDQMAVPRARRTPLRSPWQTRQAGRDPERRTSAVAIIARERG